MVTVEESQEVRIGKRPSLSLSRDNQIVECNNRFYSQLEGIETSDASRNGRDIVQSNKQTDILIVGDLQIRYVDITLSQEIMGRQAWLLSRGKD